MTVQIVEIGDKEMAMLPVEEYRQLVDIAEDKADLQAALAAGERRQAGEEYLPAELLDRIMAGESPLRAWRRHRGFTLGQLGSRVGRQAPFVHKLEKGKAEGGIDLWIALARALDVSVEDLRIEI